MNNKKKGISLMMLIITIIIMIILATVVILTLENSGILTDAHVAITETDLANAKQLVQVTYSEWMLDSENIMAENDNIKSYKDYAKLKFAESGFKTEGAGTIDVSDEGEIGIYPVIPNGFVASDIAGENSVASGLVIYEGNEKVSTDTDAQTTRNQFVWVPVPDMNDFVREDGYVNFNKQNFISSGASTEPFSKEITVDGNKIRLSIDNDLTGEYDEYAKMYASVEKYGGFYIGRYETGTTVERIYGKNNGTTPAVICQSAIVYNWVCWGVSMTDVTGDCTGKNGKNEGKGAVEISRTMYESNDSVNSVLMYGIQKDAVLKFISDKYDIKDSTTYGNHKNNAAKESVNPNNPAKTGSHSSWKTKNIYDIAGNLYEWTMEAMNENSRVLSGGTRGLDGNHYSVSARNYSTPDFCGGEAGFRVALYLI